MTKLTQLDEVIELIMYLQNSYSGLTLDEMAEKLERPRRTIERMKSLLVDKFGDKLEEVQTGEKKKRWRLKKGAANFLITLSDSDFANLELLKNQLSNESKKKEVEILIGKLKVLNKTTNKSTDIDALLEAQGFAVKQYPREKIDPKISEKIQEAILSMKKLKIVYTNNYNKTAENIIYPYGILIAGKQYLIAYNELRKEVLEYKISKISSIEVLEEYFDKPEDFDLKKYSENSFVIYQGEILDVLLEFDKEVKEEILNYHFHPSQEMTELANGNIEVNFKASGSFEIITELLKWRNTVKILAPKSLQDEYIQDVKKMYKNIKELS